MQKRKRFLVSNLQCSLNCGEKNIFSPMHSQILPVNGSPPAEGARPDGKEPGT